MNQAYRAYPAQVAGKAAVERRARFIVRTYNHLFGAILAFAGIEYALFSTGMAEKIAVAMMSVNWLFVLGGFVIGGWLFSRLAHSAETAAGQYVGLGAYVALEALIFVPLLYIAERFAPGAISVAGIATMLGFGALTAIAFVTRKDFSFLKGFLFWGMAVAMILIIAGAIFGFQLGTFFSVAMIGLAGAAILYDTSNVLHHFPEDRYVAASLQLFTSVALMFWYVLSLVLSMSRD